MNPEAEDVIAVIEQLDPILLERAYLRVLNDMQAKEIARLIEGEDSE